MASSESWMKSDVAGLATVHVNNAKRKYRNAEELERCRKIVSKMFTRSKNGVSIQLAILPAVSSARGKVTP